MLEPSCIVDEAVMQLVDLLGLSNVRYYGIFEERPTGTCAFSS